MAKAQRTFEVMQYLSYMNGKTIDDIEKSIQDIPHLKTYCLILHDQDIKDDGTPKPPHFHAVLTFTQPKTYKTVADAIGVEEQYVNRIKTTTRAAQLYLIHHNDKAKFQYVVDAVRANFDYAELVDDSPVVENINSILKDIECERIRPYNVIDYVGIGTYTKYKKRLNDAFEYVMLKKRGLNRNMRCFYFYGASGAGKTTYAKIFANQNGWSTFVSSGGKNPLDDYKGEDCIILDDLRGSLFSLADFLKLTDNNTDSMVGCRYYNKSLAYCRAIICTSVLSLDDLYNGVTDTHKEPLKQLYRRFETVIKFTDEKLLFYQYDGKESLVYVGAFLNPVTAMFSKEFAKKTMDSLAKTFGLEIAPPPAQDDFVSVDNLPADDMPEFMK